MTRRIFIVNAAVAAVLTVGVASAQQVLINAGGATFPYPMYSKWFDAYNKKFPNIADPGADRILLFGGISPVAAVPSNCPHVLMRIRKGREHENYGVNYKSVQRMIADEVPEKFDPRMRAYLLLKVHGQQICKRTNPKCSSCPVADSCALFQSDIEAKRR